VLRDVETQGLALFIAECEPLAVQHGPRFRPSPWLQSLALRDAGLHTTSWSPP
jgi:hypothetical protein